MISVCMASYNGSKYIGLQISSILDQLEHHDEIIIVDDASTDNTVQIILSFNDTRIKLYENRSNIGVVKTFEKSILKAKGDIIFLSDQDDIWLPGKVSIIKEVLVEHPEATLCLSDAEIIDDSNTVQHSSFFSIRGNFMPGVLQNLWKNKHLGCSIAFKRKLLLYILPFPTKVPMHDIWIGLINQIYGKTIYIDDVLFQYRRHSGNVSSMKRQKIFKMIIWRYNIICCLIIRVMNIFLCRNNIKKFF